MTKQEILYNAPDGATHYDGGVYYKKDGHDLMYLVCGSKKWVYDRDEEKECDALTIPTSSESLS